MQMGIGPSIALTRCFFYLNSSVKIRAYIRGVAYIINAFVPKF